MNIRNFAIIAHIDHGKSTLADRLLELTKTVDPARHDDQMLDRNPISRERGITIKLAPVRMSYHANDIEYQLNLIDTPGHVDFSYEVDRTLSCVEGVILLVDATKGIQAQTISNAYKAIEKDLVIIPVVNKVDLPSAQVEATKQQLVDFLGVRHDDIFEISAKTGLGVAPVLNAVLDQIPAPASQAGDGSLKALIFDSYYDPHRGVIAFVRVVDGSLAGGTKLKLAVSKIQFETPEVGMFTPDLIKTQSLNAGEIGYIVTNLKDIHEVRVGDTVALVKDDTGALPGYKQVKSMVYASIFPTDTADYLNLKKALEKLYLNDSSLEFSAIYSQALGAGFRVGFLGLLHADVVRERLEREYELSLVLTPPQVEYDIRDGQFFEPMVRILIVAPQEHMGVCMRLCEERRAEFVSMDNKNQITLTYRMPMSEMIGDFFDALKSATSGYASLDWEFDGYEHASADKLTIMINLEPIEEFSEIVVAERAQERGGELVKKLREVIPRQQYDIKLQAQYKGKIIASERIAQFRKDVLMKGSKVVGGGDVGRKKKLLEKQKEGKKKMKMVGRVEVPKEAFLKLFNKSS